jgi:DNA-directed RNA polymerase beta subunit
MVGPMYFIKLYHLPEFSGKVTPSIINRDAPIAGKGKYRMEGQKIGEMEMWSLLSYNQGEFIASIRTDEVSDNYSFFNNLLMIGLNLKNDNQSVVNTDGDRKINNLLDKYKK